MDDKRIEVMVDGPYLVRGGVPLTRRAIVASEHGEPMTWQTKATLPTREIYSLCRCGNSANKPFCDGSHLRSLFDGRQSAPTTTYDDRATTYEGPGIVMRDDRGICEHAGFCGNRLSNVWKMVGAAVTEDSIARAQVMAMIERCPSGALTYRITPDGADIEPEVPASIGVTDNGPLFVTGAIPVQRADGQPFEARNRVTLCRCGASANKPLCDGSHKASGFHDS